MALLHRCACLHEAVHLDYRHLTYRPWGWNGHILLLSPLLFGWNSLRPFQHLQHHLFHIVDTADSLQRGYAPVGFWCALCDIEEYFHE